MKKIICVILSFTILFLCGCRNEELINIHVFIDRFNRTDTVTRLNSKELYANEYNNEVKYNFLIDSNYLLTVRSDNSSGKIKGCYITMRFNIGNSSKKFVSICKNVMIAYEKIKAENAEKILKDFNMDNCKNRDNFSKAIGEYKYSFYKNSYGLSFNIESIRLSNESTTALKP